jgi:hypothetical protein
LNKLCFIAIEEKHSFQVNPFGHDFFPNVHIFLASRKAVQQVPTAIIVSLNLLLNQFDHKLTGNKLALTDFGFDLFSKGRARFYFISQQVTR